MSYIFILHIASTWMMIGIIWFVQLVQYPILSIVERESFITYEKSYCRKITPLVLTIMSIELITGGALCFFAGGFTLFLKPQSITTTHIGFLLLLLIWVSTLLIQSRLHGKLLKGFDVDIHRKLVSSNWIRTTLWSVRGYLVFTLLG